MKTNLKLITTLLLAIAVSFACNRDDEEATMELTTEQEVEVVENNTTTESFADEDVDITSTMEAEINSQQRSASAVCAEVSWNAEAKILTIDFGDGCVGPYGRERSGIIYVAYSNEPDGLRSDKEITFENYFVNNRQITGAISVSKLNMNNEGNYESVYTLIDYTVTFPNEQSFTLNGGRTREIIQGIDDGKSLMIEITGSLTGEDTRGRTFSSEVTDPIIADFACAANGGFIRTQGRKEIIYTGLRNNRERIVEYGDGTCDNTIRVTINGNTYTITGS